MPAPATSAPRPDTLRRVLLNGAALVGAYILPRVFTAAAVVVAARILGPGRFGAYGTAAALAVILSIVATLGMMPLLVREMVRSPERAPALLRAAHVVKAGSGLLMLVSLVGISHFALSYPPTVVAASLLLGLAYAVGGFVENLGAWFQAIERMHVWMQASAAFGLVTGAAGAWLVWSTGSVVWFCFAPLLGQLAALSWLLAKAPRRLRTPGHIEGAQVIRLVRALIPFAAAFVALTLFYKVDVLLLTRWRASADVGTYVAAYKFVDVAHALILAAVAAVYPRLARLAPGGEGADPDTREANRSEQVEAASPAVRRWAATRVSELLLLAVVPAAALLWILRGELVEGLYGTGFAPAGFVLALLAPALPALALNLLAGYVLAATGHMRLVAGGYAAALLLKVGLDALLIPVYGAPGAGAAMLVSELALAAGFLVTLRWVAEAAPDRRSLGLAGAAAALAVALAVLSPLLVGERGAALIYAAGVFVLYGRGAALAPREWRILRRALRP